MESTIASARFGSIKSAFKFSELAARVAEVDTEHDVLVRMIQMVRRDLKETNRLFNLSSIQRKLSSTPDKLPWITGTLHSTQSCLNEIGKWVERTGTNQETSRSARLEIRVRTVFRDHEKLTNRKLELSMCHQQLLTVLNYLIPMEIAPVTIEPYGSICFEDIVPPTRRPRRSSIYTIKSSDSNLGPSSTPRENRTADSRDITTRTNDSPTTANTSPISCTSEPSLANVLPQTIHSHTRTMSTPSLWQSDPTALSLGLSLAPRFSDTVQRPQTAGSMYSSRHFESDRKDRLESSFSSGSFAESLTSAFPFLASLDITTAAGQDPLGISDTNMGQDWPQCANQKASDTDGVTISLDPNNNNGPVNPFELLRFPSLAHNQPTEPPQISTTEEQFSTPLPHAYTAPELSRRNPGGLTELIGDLYFPVELPSHEVSPISPAQSALSDSPRHIPTRKPVPARDPSPTISELPSGDFFHLSQLPYANQSKLSLQSFPSTSNIRDLPRTSTSSCPGLSRPATHASPYMHRQAVSQGSPFLASSTSLQAINSTTSYTPKGPTFDSMGFDIDGPKRSRMQRQKKMLQLMSSIE